MIFGGEAFLDWIGELSLMKALTKQMDITMREEEEAAAAAAAAAEADGTETAEGERVEPSASTSGSTFTPDIKVAPGTKEFEAQQEAAHHHSNVEDDPPPVYTPSPEPSRSTTPRPSGIPTRLALEHSPNPSTDQLSSEAGMSEEEKRLREKQNKRGGLTKEQREELLAFELERKRQREERVSTLSRKLVDRLSVWTETDRGRDLTEAFRAQINLEIENLRMESFGLEILHAIGATYLSKGTSFLKSQKLFGISGFWSRLKEKGTLAKETWTTISTAIDAQMTMEEMAKLEEKGGEDWTDERKAEYEKRVTGKILAAAWRGSKYEIQS